jgi:hypothetical protein
VHGNTHTVLHTLADADAHVVVVSGCVALTNSDAEQDCNALHDPLRHCVAVADA